MSVTVTLHVYSGRPDPSWELSDEQARELADRLDAITNITRLKPVGIAGGLGYRGFSISAIREKRLDPLIYLHENIVDFNRFDVNRTTDTPELEKWLLDTGRDNVPDDVKDHVSGLLDSSGLQPMDAFRPAAVPVFDPGKWNNDPIIRTRNNCYNYANDKITNTFAQPGRGSGLMYSEMSCANVGLASARDGQERAPAPSTSPANGHFIALVMWPGNDFHWYRLDRDGHWSHKPGQTAARNYDNAGNAIVDPSTCNRGPYTDFCGYFLCLPGSTRIQ